MTDTFPRQYARTQRFTLGQPRNLLVSPDGQRVVFLRSGGGSDPVNCLWVLDVATGEERLVGDPKVLLQESDDATLPAEERARRERAREGAGGVVSYATNRDVTAAAFTLAGRLFVAGLVHGRARPLAVKGPVFDARPDPAGRRLAYVSGSTLRIGELDGTSRVLAGEDTPEVSWGAADFVAAEEMDRHRGYWWAPDGEAIAACRVDNAAVGVWWIADPSHPERDPVAHRYPAAGTDNPTVELYVLPLDGGERVRVEWDSDRYPYLADVGWFSAGLLLTVQSRDQRDLAVLRADRVSGATTVVHLEHDDAWVYLTPGSPRLLPDGRLVVAADRGGQRRVLLDGIQISPDDVEVRSIGSCAPDAIAFTGSPVDDPTTQETWRWNGRTCELIVGGPGLHSASVGGATVVTRSVDMDSITPRTTVVGGPAIAGVTETPLVNPNVRLLRVGRRRLAAAVLLPHGCPDDARLPVLLDPYGGPGAQRVVSNRAAYLASQWFADQGFAVVVIDGRGTPGRGHAWERSVHLDLAGPVLDDQVDGLLAIAEEVPQLDLTRVGIRGWSFGGYLAALAVLRRPDIFHAAVAGAPVTEWRLYDTHYTERYLGNPAEDPGPYDRCSLLLEADRLERPLMLIHGLADDNVVAAHTLQFSQALLAAGRPHEVLPLSGVTHMTPPEVVAENLLLMQIAFLRRSLAC